MRFPRFKLDRDLLQTVVQAFDISGTMRSSRLNEILARTPEQALARDWDNITGDWDGVARPYAAAHGE